MLRLSAGLLIALAAGCGLVNEDITRVSLRFPKHDFSVDTHDWGLAAGTSVPSVSCQQVSCEQAGALFCGQGCRGSCDAATQKCQAAVLVTLVNDFDLAVEAPEYQKIADQPVIDVTIDDVYFDISENTLDIAVPSMVVFIGPPSVTSPDDPGAERVGTIPTIAAHQTGRSSISFEGNGRAIMSRYLNDFHTPFRVGVSGEIALHAGDPVPTGRLVGSVQANAHAGFDAEVVIAGGGPGGASLVARLHQLDPALARRTIVLDRARFPRAKPCGGGLTGHAAEAMHALGLELDVERLPAPSATVRYAAFERRVALPRPVNIVRREELDASLLAQARARGADVREGEPLEDFAVEDGGVTVRTRRGRLRARVLVGADGAGSLVRKRLQPREGGAPIRLFRAEIPAPPAWRGRDDMLYDFSLMARGLRGYLWVFPVHDDRLNVGLMHSPTEKRSGGELVELLRDGLRGHGLELGDGARGWPAWGYTPSGAVSAPHVLLLGDAAGIDALTGEGIAVAMEHALIAGDAIDAAIGGGDFRFRGFRRALRVATVGRELNLDRWLARLLYGGPRWRRWLSLVLHDPDVLELYAARVAGGLVLADQKLRLFAALARHLFARRPALV